MPQMAPINWTLMYFYFILLFLLSITLIYYLYIYPPKTKSFSKKINLTNWKW